MNHRTDTCPTCGATRIELVVVPGRFYCPACQAATPGPTTAADAPAGAQLALTSEGPLPDRHGRRDTNP